MGIVGNAYVVGEAGPGFRVTSDAAQATFGGGATDGFLAVLDVTGGVRYATFVGAAEDDSATGVAVDSRSRVAISGTSLVKGWNHGGFLARLERPGAPFRYAEAVSDSLSVAGVAAGPDDSIYATGSTNSPDFPVTRPAFATWFNTAPRSPKATCVYGRDEFVLRLDPESLRPTYSVLLGDCPSYRASRLSIRPDGAAVLRRFGGDTSPQRAPLSMGGSLFWTEISPDGSALRYSGPLGPVEAQAAPDGSFFGYSGVNIQRVTIPVPPDISIDHVANAFSGVGSGVSPGALYRLTGSGLGPADPVSLGLDAKDPATDLGGVRVFFGSAPARLQYVSADRIFCIAPDTKAAGIRVEYQGQRSNEVAFSLGGDPGVLTEPLPAGNAVQLLTENPDGSRNAPDNPAPRGSAVTMYATGTLSSELWFLERAVSIKPDPRFPFRVYRITASIPADVPAGEVTARLAEHHTVGLGGSRPRQVISTPIGNPVTIFVK